MNIIFWFSEHMQTRALKTLTSIARHGSFIAAAEQLNMTLSAVSTQIKTLEEELGVLLFDRAHRPPRLTPQGRAVCARAEDVLEREAALVAECQTGGALAGRFRIGFVATASIRLLPGFLAHAQAEAPKARLDIETGTSTALEDRVSAGQLDAAVVTASQAPPPGLRYDPLLRERLVLACPIGHDPDLDGLFRTLPFFHFQPQSGIGKLIADHVAPYQMADTRVIYLDSVEAIMECVNRGLGFTLLPEPDARRRLGATSRLGFNTPDTLTRDLVLVTSDRSGSGRLSGLVGLFHAEQQDQPTG